MFQRSTGAWVSTTVEAPDQLESDPSILPQSSGSKANPISNTIASDRCATKYERSSYSVDLVLVKVQLIIVL